ncbi:hypothetical protein ABZ372_27930, partial [Streptomyces sp. NPDC005921]
MRSPRTVASGAEDCEHPSLPSPELVKVEEVSARCAAVALRSDAMKLVVQVKLLPSPEQASALEATLRACNRAATHASQVAFTKQLTDRNSLHKEVYADLRATFGLSAQPAVRAVKKVVDAYTTLKANLRAGNLGPPASKRYRTAIATPISFRPEAAQPFDDRCLSWQYDARTVSIWTVDGRMKNVRFACSADQMKSLVAHRKGESDLVRRDGKWFLIASERRRPPRPTPSCCAGCTPSSSAAAGTTHRR